MTDVLITYILIVSVLLWVLSLIDGHIEKEINHTRKRLHEEFKKRGVHNVDFNKTIVPFDNYLKMKEKKRRNLSKMFKENDYGGYIATFPGNTNPYEVRKYCIIENVNTEEACCYALTNAELNCLPDDDEEIFKEIIATR